jgi:hypothetical protein
MKSHMIARFEGVCAHFPLRGRDGVDLVGVRSGSGNSLGCPRVETILNAIICELDVCDKILIEVTAVWVVVVTLKLLSSDLHCTEILGDKAIRSAIAFALPNFNKTKRHSRSLAFCLLSMTSGLHIILLVASHSPQ